MGKVGEDAPDVKPNAALFIQEGIFSPPNVFTLKRQDFKRRAMGKKKKERF